jgi:hypothetical protein
VIDQRRHRLFYHIFLFRFGDHILLFSRGVSEIPPMSNL